jgi:phosphate transport system substrate-binding protein
MNHLALVCLAVLAPLPGGGATNLPPATTLLLGEKASFELTAGLAQYEHPPRFSGRFSSAGGGVPEILVNRWATEFIKLYPEVEPEARGGGSVGGLAGLLAGTVDLVPMERPLSAEEVSRFRAKFGYPPAQIVVALDALGIYVNKDNPVAGLTLAQLDGIYSRDAKRGGGHPEFWSELGVTGGLAGARISRLSLSEAHGSYLFFQEQVMRGAEYRFDVGFERVPGSLVQAVGADDAGIGFASIMFATARTRFVPLQASDGRYLPPSYENTLSGQYPLVRPMRIVFQRRPDGSMNRAAREFLRFAVSRRGQRIIAVAGSYPLTVEQQQEALRTIGGSPKK